MFARAVARPYRTQSWPAGAPRGRTGCIARAAASIDGRSTGSCAQAAFSNKRFSPSTRIPYFRGASLLVALLYSRPRPP